MRLDLLFCSMLSGILFITGCETISNSQRARVELQKQNIAFNPDRFVQAADDGNLDMVKLFLQAGMNVDATNKYGYTGLIWAAGVKVAKL